MPAAISHRRLLVGSALVAYGVVFACFLVFEVPGLGLGHFFYVPVAMIALATGPVLGAVAGVLAAALYMLGVLLNPHIPSTEVLTLSTIIRLVTYTACGALIGWFAQDNRRLLERLQMLVERDALTGLPNTRAFEAAIQRRLETGGSFALLIGDLDRLREAHDVRGHLEGNDLLRRLADMLGRSLGPADEFARVGDDEFAVLATVAGSSDAARLCARLESTLAQRGLGMRFGWAVHPEEGRNALSLYRAADERLYARTLLASQAVAAQSA